MELSRQVFGFFFFPEDKAFILWMYLMMVELNDEVIKEKT